MGGVSDSADGEDGWGTRKFLSKVVDRDSEFCKTYLRREGASDGDNPNRQAHR